MRILVLGSHQRASCSTPVGAKHQQNSFSHCDAARRVSGIQSFKQVCRRCSKVSLVASREMWDFVLAPTDGLYGARGYRCTLIAVVLQRNVSFKQISISRIIYIHLDTIVIQRASLIVSDSVALPRSNWHSMAIWPRKPPASGDNPALQTTSAPKRQLQGGNRYCT